MQTITPEAYFAKISREEILHVQFFWQIAILPLRPRLTALRPDMKVIYMSGYSNPLPSRPGHEDTERTFIQKPFTTDNLALKVREVLGKSAESKA
jgi:DNA-binding NtrC family response regulator